jgi:hypothetical protein
MATKNKKRSVGVNFIMFWAIRLILILLFAFSITTEGILLQTLSFIAFLLTFIPGFLSKYFKIRVPAAFEMILLMSIFGFLFLGEVRNLYDNFWWWDILLNFIASIALGFIGLSVLFVLYQEGQIDTNPIFIAVITFLFAVSMGALWEIFEFALDLSLGTGLQRGSLIDTMEDMIVTVIGAVAVSVLGFICILNNKPIVISTSISNFFERNTQIFGPRKRKVDAAQKVLALIKNGENERSEFKSSLRTNLHTKEIDKKIEHSALKTIAALLNTKGGNLLVGVSDGGDILGLEQDNFQNDDKLGLHLTNRIKTHIGSEFLPFITFKIVTLGDKKVLLVSCRQSKKRVFLKFGHEEEFYVRNGPASLRLEGSSLVDYIQHKF